MQTHPEPASKRRPPSRHTLEGSYPAVVAATATPQKPAYTPVDPLLAARESAMEAGQSISSFWRNVRAGRLPQPIYVSPRCPRWRRSEILAALEALRGAR